MLGPIGTSIATVLLWITVIGGLVWALGAGATLVLWVYLLAPKPRMGFRRTIWALGLEERWAIIGAWPGFLFVALLMLWLRPTIKQGFRMGLGIVMEDAQRQGPEAVARVQENLMHMLADLRAAAGNPQDWTEPTPPTDSPRDVAVMEPVPRLPSPDETTRGETDE